jgi:hypothetical protein
VVSHDRAITLLPEHDDSGNGDQRADDMSQYGEL